MSHPTLGRGTGWALACLLELETLGNISRSRLVMCHQLCYRLICLSPFIVPVYMGYLHIFPPNPIPLHATCPDLSQSHLDLERHVKPARYIMN